MVQIKIHCEGRVLFATLMQMFIFQIGCRVDLTIILPFFHIQPQVNVVTIVDGLKRLYAEKLKPLEVAYRFNDFATPVLVSELPFQNISITPREMKLSLLF